MKISKLRQFNEYLTRVKNLDLWTWTCRFHLSASRPSLFTTARGPELVVALQDPRGVHVI